jgi:hypothetical protein
MQPDTKITQLLETVKKQSEEIAVLKKWIAELETRLLRYEHPKNSSNSSPPSSQDPFRIKRTESLRENSGKIDIPPLLPVITEQRIYSRTCSCSHCQRSDYPLDAHSSVCYGENLTGLTAYLHSRQYIPFERIRELYGDIFNLDISSGSQGNVVERFVAKSAKIYEIIRSRIAVSPVVSEFLQMAKC